MIDQLFAFADKASPEVIQVPYQVKYLKNKCIQTCNLDTESMRLYPAKHLMEMERMLMNQGFFSVEKKEAADYIQSYNMDKFKRYNQLKNKMKGLQPQPVRPKGQASEGERVIDRELLASLEEIEEGEIDLLFAESTGIFSPTYPPSL
ncbi:hypothetical protein ACR2XN_28135 [Klebsiella pneumoniae]